MGQYKGCQCGICHKIFTEEDDIVTCPDCGTPYHRSCWQSVGHCSNTALHAVGGSWQAAERERRERMGGLTCQKCGTVNLPGEEYCSACGTHLRGQAEQDENGRMVLSFRPGDPLCGMPADEEFEGERLEDISTFVRTNTLYYIPLFKRFKETGRRLSFNLPCVLFPYFYFANRKMWPMALLTGALNLLCGLPVILLRLLYTLTDTAFTETLTQYYGAESVQMFDGMTAFLQAHEELLNDLNIPMYFAFLALRIGLCMFGNYLYYQFVIKRVRRIRETAPTPAIRHALLEAEGGTNVWNIVGMIGLYYAALFVIYAVLWVCFF